MRPATSPLVTRDMLHAEIQVVRTEVAEFRADMYRALWVFGTGIVAIVGVIVGVATALD